MDIVLIFLYNRAVDLMLQVSVSYSEESVIYPLMHT